MFTLSHQGWIQTSATSFQKLVKSSVENKFQFDFVFLQCSLFVSESLLLVLSEFSLSKRQIKALYTSFDKNFPSLPPSPPVLSPVPAPGSVLRALVKLSIDW